MTKHRTQEERRAQILTAAKKCFINKGFAHTRVDDIATEAGLSKGGIYFHFRSKREIFDALHDQEIQRTVSVVEDQQLEGASAVAKLAAMGASLLQHFAGRDDHRRFLVVLAEMGIREPEVHEKIVASHEKYLASLTEQIQQGVTEGELRSVDAEAAALVMKLLVDGIEQAFALGYRVDVAKLMTVGIDIILHGLAPNNDS